MWNLDHNLLYMMLSFDLCDIASLFADTSLQDLGLDVVGLRTPMAQVSAQVSSSEHLQ